MAFKFNPITGKLDIASSGGGGTIFVEPDENTLLNTIVITGDFTIFGDQSIKIINIATSANNKFMQSITINGDGELIIGNSATLEVA